MVLGTHTLVDDQDAIEEFATRAADEALGDRVGPWCPHRGLNDADIERGEDGVEPGGELGIAIPEEDRTRRPASPRSSDREQRGAAGIAALRGRGRRRRNNNRPRSRSVTRVGVCPDSEEPVSVHDCSVDLARSNDLPRTIDRPDNEGETMALRSVWRLGIDFDAVADRRRAAVLDSDGRADRCLTGSDERCGALDGGRLHPRDQPRGREHRDVTAAHHHRGVDLGYLEAHRPTVCA
jgi:hypothetical protein